MNIASNELIHFVGIGGIGMSGLAQIMYNMGFRIQGSDVSENKNTERLKKFGIKIFIGHKRNNIKTRFGSPRFNNLLTKALHKKNYIKTPYMFSLVY